MPKPLQRGAGVRIGRRSNPDGAFSTGVESGGERSGRGQPAATGTALRPQRRDRRDRDRDPVEHGVARERVEQVLVGEDVRVRARRGRRRRQRDAGRAVAPAVRDGHDAGMTASVTSTGTSTAPARELTRASAPSARPERPRRRGGRAAVQRAGPADQQREVVHPGVVRAQVAPADEQQPAVLRRRDGDAPLQARTSATSCSGASSIRPLAVRSTSGSRGSSGPRSIPCGAASSAASEVAADRGAKASP